MTQSYSSYLFIDVHVFSYPVHFRLEVELQCPHFLPTEAQFLKGFLFLWAFPPPSPLWNLAFACRSPLFSHWVSRSCVPVCCGCTSCGSVRISQGHAEWTHSAPNIFTIRCALQHLASIFASSDEHPWSDSLDQYSGCPSLEFCKG